MANTVCQTFHTCTCTICQRHPYSHVAQQHRAINRVLASLNERNRRRFVGLLAIQWGRGHIARLSQITGLSRNTIYRGRQEVEHPRQGIRSGVRRPGGGRPKVEKNSPAF
jgi:hypothetical protein